MYIRTKCNLLLGTARTFVQTAASVIVVLGILAGPVQAGFLGQYSLDSFSLFNTNADGSWRTPDSGATLLLTGGNNGTGLPGTTYLLLLAPEDALISFHYEHTTVDEFPEYDASGYLIRGQFWALSALGPSGRASFLVARGEGFGFGVRTDDNWGGAATLAISDFQANQVPEPATGVSVLLTAAACLVRMLRGRSWSWRP